MAVNIFDVLKGAAGDHLATEAGQYLGVPQELVAKASQSILPVLAGALIRKSATTTDTEGIVKFLSTHPFETDLPESPEELSHEGPLMHNLLNSGGVALNYLMGDASREAVDKIVKSSGLNSEAVDKLMKISTSILFGSIAKHVHVSGSGSAELREALVSQAADVPGVSIPVGIARVEEATAVEQSPGEISATGPEQSRTLLNRLLPWLVLLLAALGLLYFLNKGCAGSNTRMGDRMETSGRNEIPSASATSGNAGEAVIQRKPGTVILPGGKKMSVDNRSPLAQLVELISGESGSTGKGIILDRVTFTNMSSDLTPGSSTQLLQLVNVLKAYPDTRIRIECHTDNTGSAESNMQLSTRRARSVKEFLEENGIAGDRIDTAGRGQLKPLASNDTETGKSQNRRVEIYLVR